MELDINKKLISDILEKIPKTLKPVVYLTDLLDLSRESAYRRIRCEIPFTLEEITKLSLDLNLSIDKVINENDKERASFEFVSKGNASLNFLSMLKKSRIYIEHLINAKNSESIVALNYLPPVYTSFYDNLFKFTYYKWIYLENGVSRTAFSEIEIPEEINVLQKEIRASLKNINNSTLILDPNLFLSMIKDIQYYHQRKGINEKDKEMLMKDMADLIELFEKTARSGVLDSNAKIDLYLSPLSVNTNSAYFEYGNTVESIVWVFSGNPTLIFHSEFCNLQKKWLMALKRQSMLISQSNEILQMEFFEKQREYLT
jgi:hypothetical protein